MTATATIVGIEIEHATSESWYLELPVELADTRAATLAALVGATAQLRLLGKTTAQAAAEIVFRNARCRIEEDRIVLDATPALFTGKAGSYEGNVMLRLSSGALLKTHEVKLRVVEAPAWQDGE